MANTDESADSGRSSKRELQRAKKQAYEELRRSEERYRTLFESIDEGFCIIEVLFDESDEPVDYRFLETNPAFEEQTELTNVTGRRMRELEPRLQQHWFETYGRVALTGEPEQFVRKAEHLDNRWYDVYAFRIGQPEERKVAILFNDITEQKQVQEALRELASELAMAEQRERQRIAHVLHEHIQQSLYGTEMTVRRLAKQAERLPAFAGKEKHLERLHSLEGHLDTVIETVRTLSVELSPPLAQGDDLKTSLRWLVGHMKEEHELEVYLNAGEIGQAPEGDLQAFLVQVARELLFNVVKHAEVSEAKLEVKTEAGWLTMKVSDHGAGFETEWLEEDPSVYGFGLASMRERLVLLGGELHVESALDEGTRVIVSVPWDAQAGIGMDETAP